MSGGSGLVVMGGRQCRGDEAVKLQVLMNAAWRHRQLGSFHWPNGAIINMCLCVIVSSAVMQSFGDCCVLGLVVCVF